MTNEFGEGDRTPVELPIFHAKVVHPFHHRQVARLRRHAAMGKRRTVVATTATPIVRVTRARVAIATEVSEAKPATVVTGVATETTETTAMETRGVAGVAPVIVADAEAVAIAAAEKVVARAVARAATTTVVIPAVHAITWTPRLISSRGARARNETGVRLGAISCVCMFATISRK